MTLAKTAGAMARKSASCSLVANIVKTHDVDTDDNHYVPDKATVLHFPGGTAIGKGHMDTVTCYTFPQDLAYTRCGPYVAHGSLATRTE